MNIAGKKVAITGGSGGMGSLLAKRFIALKAHPIIIDRVDEINFAATYIKGDLSTFDGVLNIVDELKKHKPDILINLAGIQYFGNFEEQSPENIAVTYFVNLVAPVLLTQGVLPEMKKNRSGQIVNIGSIFASINFAHFVTYSSSKAGIKGFSEGLRRELKDSGIDVTYIAPRTVKTPLNNHKATSFAKQTKANIDSPEYAVERILKAIIERKKDVYIGFAECLFVRINSLLPRIVDGALAKNNKIANAIINN
jgi:short-subunit dehydrogenase